MLIHAFFQLDIYAYMDNFPYYQLLNNISYKHSKSHISYQKCVKSHISDMRYV